MNELLGTSQVCAQLGIAETTLRNWYKWYKIKTVDCPELPMPKKIGTKNMWNVQDVELIKVFQDWIPKGRNGKMSVVNSKYWRKKTNE